MDAVVDNSPADALFYQDHALGRGRFFFECGFENDAFVISFRNTDEFMDARRADEVSRKRASERRASRLHVANELTLRARHSEIWGLPFESFFVITIVEN